MNPVYWLLLLTVFAMVAVGLVCRRRSPLAEAAWSLAALAVAVIAVGLLLGGDR